MKRLSIGILVGLLLSLPLYSLADTVSMIGKKVETEVGVSLNGNALENKGIAIDGTSYLPIRALADAIGLEVNYNIEKKVVELSSPQSVVPDIVVTQEEETQVYRLEYVVDTINHLNLRIMTDKYALNLAEESNDTARIAEMKKVLAKNEAELARWEVIKAELEKK